MRHTGDFLIRHLSWMRSTWQCPVVALQIRTRDRRF